MGTHAAATRGRRPAEILTTGAPSRPVALVLALLVTFLWSTSWVLIKIGLNDLALPPLLFAGLRYSLAAAILVPLALPALRRSFARGIDRRAFALAAVLGLLIYTLTQGAQFAALAHLPAVAFGLALSTTPILVAVMAHRRGERPSTRQALGITAVVAGAALYFGPAGLGTLPAIGLVIAAIAVAANAASALLGRSLARDALPAVGGVIGLTAVSMAIGAVVLLAVGLATERLPAMDVGAWLIVGWLALVNTAFAFTLWNHTLRTLTATESSVVNNLMLVQIAVLAWLFLGETLDGLQVTGLAIAMAGILAVQLARPARPNPALASDGR